MSAELITDEKLAELREVAAAWPVLAALLDERDRLTRDAERWHLAYVGESIRVSELEAELADRGSQCNR